MSGECVLLFQDMEDTGESYLRREMSQNPGRRIGFGQKRDSSFQEEEDGWKER